jgi:hypothetical protein
MHDPTIPALLFGMFFLAIASIMDGMQSRRRMDRQVNILYKLIDSLSEKVDRLLPKVEVTFDEEAETTKKKSVSPDVPKTE